MINLLKNSHFYCLFYIGIPQYLIKHLIKKQSQVRGKKFLISKFVSNFKKLCFSFTLKLLNPIYLFLSFPLFMFVNFSQFSLFIHPFLPFSSLFTYLFPFRQKYFVCAICQSFCKGAWHRGCSCGFCFLLAHINLKIILQVLCDSGRIVLCSQWPCSPGVGGGGLGKRQSELSLN